jgi:uncharacterized membrane protein (UPF0127 family)
MILKINDNKFKVKTMITKKDTQKGMMGRDFDSTFNGMLFLMDQGHHGFWMKNCIIPLDIIFINGNEITKIHHNCPPCETKDCPSYVGEGDTILELKGGTCKKLGIKDGDIIRY